MDENEKVDEPKTDVEDTPDTDVKDEPTNTDVVEDVDADTSDTISEVKQESGIDAQRLDKLEGDMNQVFAKVTEIADALGALVVNGGASVIDNDTATDDNPLDGFERKPDLDLKM
jgi:hypothetical protein